MKLLVVTGINKGILRVGVCIGGALLQSTLVQAQDAVPRVLPEPTILPELSKRTGPEPLKAQGSPIPDAERPSLEVLAGAPNEKHAPIVKQTPPPKMAARPAAVVEKIKRIPKGGATKGLSFKNLSPMNTRP